MIGPIRRLSPGLPGLQFLGQLAQQPDVVAARVRALAGQLTQVAVGTSNVTPSSRDRRFADPAWIENPLLLRLVQTYLAVSETLEAVLQDVSMEYRDAERA